MEQEGLFSSTQNQKVHIMFPQTVGVTQKLVCVCDKIVVKMYFSSLDACRILSD